MLQWTAAGPGRRLALLVDHTDAEREFDYRVSPMGRLELALAEAQRARLDGRQHEGRLEADLRRGNQKLAKLEHCRFLAFLL